nr:choice-of-anchor J domain-containing protein [Bacteroidales bacterium]
CATEDATIYYSTESEEGPWNAYEAPIEVASSMTLWAYAEKEGYDSSAVVSAEYVINTDMVVLFNQDWEGDWNGWTEVSVVGDPQWEINSYSGNHYAYANAYNEGATEDWLISPAFDLNAHPDALLSFRTARNYNGPDIEVYFSNDYAGDPAAATWQPIVCELSTGSWTWVETGDLSMSAFSGSNCYIGYRYTSTEDSAAGWEVDDIMMYCGSAADIPYLNATPNSLTGFSYMVGEGPSEPQTFVLTGGNLPPMPGSDTGGVVLTMEGFDFEMSLDGETYSHDLVIEVVGTLEPTTVYVRMNAEDVGIHESIITIEGSGDVSIIVGLTGEVEEYDAAHIDAYMPKYIQGMNGSNNDRVPVAIATYLYNLEPNSTYRYVNQFVDDNDGDATAGAGNVIYASADGFYRSTSPSLSTEGGYGEFTTDENGEGFVWFINEPTANARFTPGNHVYLRIRINDGQDGTDVDRIFTTTDYATVLSFGNEAGANQGTAFYAASEEAPMSFVMMFSNDYDMRPTYSTSIETTGVDYAGINQYADFYKEEVAGKDGYFGGIIPNDNADGINIIWVLDMESYVVNDYYTENGLWGVTATANPTAGLDEPLFIDLIGLSVDEGEAMDVKVWNFGHEIMVENAETERMEMTVYNLLGQPVMTKTIAGESNVRVSHNLADGLYVITLQNAQGKMSAKIVVR